MSMKNLQQVLRYSDTKSYQNAWGSIGNYLCIHPVDEASYWSRTGYDITHNGESSAPWRAVILNMFWIFSKISGMDVSKIFPEVFLNIIRLLEVDKSRNRWKLTRSPNRKLSLLIDHFPAKQHEHGSANQHRSMSGFVSQKQDTTTFVPQIPPLKKKRKSPAQRRRARKRFQKWLEKRKSST